MMSPGKPRINGHSSAQQTGESYPVGNLYESLLGLPGTTGRSLACLVEGQQQSAASNKNG